MTLASTDTGELLPKSEAALVTTNRGTALELLVPDYGDEDLPELVIYLTACLLRAQDHDFLTDMIDWFKSQTEGNC